MKTVFDLTKEFDRRMLSQALKTYRANARKVKVEPMRARRSSVGFVFDKEWR